TFVPVEDVRFAEYWYLRNPKHFWSTALLIALFFIGRWFVALKEEKRLYLLGALLAVGMTLPYLLGWNLWLIPLIALAFLFTALGGYLFFPLTSLRVMENLAERLEWLLPESVMRSAMSRQRFQKMRVLQKLEEIGKNLSLNDRHKEKLEALYLSASNAGFSAFRLTILKGRLTVERFFRRQKIRLDEGGFSAFAAVYPTFLFGGFAFFKLLSFCQSLGLPLPLSPERIANIAWPVGTYFLFEWRLRHVLKRNRQKLWGIDPYKLLHLCLPLGLMAVTDAGFAVIFLLFLLISGAFKGYFKSTENATQNAWLTFFSLLASLIIVFVFVLFGGDIIKFILGYLSESNYRFAAAIAMAGLVAGLGLFFMFAVNRDKVNQNRKRILQLTLALFVGSIVMAQFVLLDNIGKKFNHVRYRAEIHSERPIDQVIADAGFHSAASTYILRAAQNQWLINTYLKQSQSRAGRSKGFDLQPHFNRGASYITQTTDLVVLRFLIAEHSEFLVLLLIFLLFLTGFSFAHTFGLQNTQQQPTHSVIFKALLLLFTISFFIWLTATNRFIFFGQDFPLISLTSIFTVLFSLGILLFVISLTSSSTYIEREKRIAQNTAASSVRLRYLSPFLVLLLMCLGFKSKKINSNVTHFNIGQQIENAQDDFQIFNEQLAAIQREWYDRGMVPQDSLIDQLLSELDERTESGKEVFTNEFTRSMYTDHFRHLANKRDPYEILHLLKQDGRYQFNLNRKYYLIEPPSNYRESWRGDVLAASVSQGLKFIGKNPSIASAAVPDVFDPNYTAILPVSMRQLKMAVIPSSWTPEKKAYVLLAADKRAGQNPNVLIRNNQNRNITFEQSASDPSIRLLENDQLRLWGESGARSYNLSRDPERYLVKNIWLNGQQKMFYPLGEKMLWAFHYSKAAQSAYSQNETFRKDVYTSIDFGLTDRLYGLMDSLLQEEDNRQAAITVLDANGRIRAISDFKAGLEVDPNDVRRLKEYQDSFYLNVDRRTERELFGNLNLMKLKIGPGSSIKPIIYGAITSQLNLNWPDFVQLGRQEIGLGKPIDPAIAKLNIDEDGHKIYDLIRYGGKPIGGQEGYRWRQPYEADFDAVNNYDYLVGSKNLYHGHILFWGSYSKQALAPLSRLLQAGQVDRLTESGLLNEWSKGQKAFPVIRFGGEKAYTFNPNAWPVSAAHVEGAQTYFGHRNALVKTGLSRNFDLATVFQKGGSRYVDIDGSRDSIFQRASRRNYSFPERSHFYQSDRVSDDRRGMRNGLVLSTLGAFPFQVTPLKMAEMHASLLSMNRNYKASLEPDGISSYDFFNFDDAAGLNSWKSEEKLLTFYKDYIFKNLSNVIDDPEMGTARALKIFIDARNDRRSRKGEIPYYYCAKTGTIDDPSREEGKEQDRLLSITISKKDLSAVGSVEELRNNRFYTIYFTEYYFGKHNWALIQETIKAVESSELFKKHMQ
ncbi:MAG: hypothetical protein AAF990_02370, partial [Bacteroidota bacterium]